jgi:hypothetical protein
MLNLWYDEPALNVTSKVRRQADSWIEGSRWRTVGRKNGIIGGAILLVDGATRL